MSYDVIGVLFLAHGPRILDFVPLHGNARGFQCMLDEDMVRRVKAICSALHPATFSLRALEHYCMAVCLRWTIDGKCFADFEGGMGGSIMSSQTYMLTPAQG